MFVARLASARSVVAAVISVLVAISVPALVSVPAAATTKADGAGYVDFGYGTATDGVTAHTSQSKLWFHDGSWWAVMMEPAETEPIPHENRWAIFRFDMTSQTWVSTKVQVDERNQSHPDVLASGDKLYVVSSYSRSESEAVKFFVYDYQAATKTYALNPLFLDADPRVDRPGRYDDGVETPAKGIQYATVARSAESLFIAYTSNNAVWYMQSDLVGLVWSAPQALDTGSMSPIAGPPGAATSSSDDVAVAVGFGSGQVGIMWSRTSSAAAPYGGFYFAVWNGSAFGAPEAAWHGDAVGDNHVSARADASGRVLVAVKTSLKGTDDPLVSVLARSAAGTWSNHTVITRQAGGVARDATRPVLALDQATAHVFMTDRVDGGSIYRNSAPLAGLSFTNGLGEAFIKSSAHPYVNDVSSTKQQADAGATGLLALASDDTDGIDAYLHGCLGTPCPTGAALPPPPTPVTPTSTSLTSSPNPSAAGTPVSLTASVSGGTGIGGTVTFFDGADQIKTVALVNGAASTTTSTLSAGKHALKAVFSSSGTYASSVSPVVNHTVLASSGGGLSAAGGTVSPPPVGTRLQVVAPSRRVLSGRAVGAGRTTLVTMPAPAGAQAVAVNVSVLAGARKTSVAVCSAALGKAACKADTVVRLGSRDRKAGFAVVRLGPGSKIKAYNARGKARITVDVQGWFVTDPSKLRFAGLTSPQRIAKAQKIGPNGKSVLRIPTRMRPAGTAAAELYLAAGSTRASNLAVCRPAAGKAACKARPSLHPGPGGTVGNRVIVPVGSDGKLKLVNSRGTARVTVYLRGLYIAG